MTILHHSTPLVQPPAALSPRRRCWLSLAQVGAWLTLVIWLAPDARPVLLTLLEMLSGAVLAWAINAVGCWLIARRCRRA